MEKMKQNLGDKKYTYVVDDNIRFLEDINRKRYKSLFDNEYLSFFKYLNNEYGMKVQLNLFYKTCAMSYGKPFNLSMMTDQYKNEWEDNSHWLKLSFHAKQESPSYPYINVSYEKMQSDYKEITDEIVRFAGKRSLSNVILPHWLPVSYEGLRGMRDLGVENIVGISISDEVKSENYIDKLTKEEKERFFENRKEHTGIYVRKLLNGKENYSLKGYNHFSEKDFGEGQYIRDEKLGMNFIQSNCICLNRYELNEIPGFIEEKKDVKFLTIGMHEQYFYEDYALYQHDYKEKVELAVKTATNLGFEAVNYADLKAESLT